MRLKPQSFNAALEGAKELSTKDGVAYVLDDIDITNPSRCYVVTSEHPSKGHMIVVHRYKNGYREF